jgi:hypothetical protein
MVIISSPGIGCLRYHPWNGLVTILESDLEPGRLKTFLSNGLDKRQSTFILFSPFISCLGAVGRIRPSPFAFLALGPLLNALHPQLAVWGCEEKVIWDTVSLELLLNLAFFDRSFAVELHAVPLVLQEVRLCT